MLALRLFLIIGWTVLLAYTSFTVGKEGINLFPAFFGAMASGSWQGQFNLDFMLMLMLSALWTGWRSGWSVSVRIGGPAVGITVQIGGHRPPPPRVVVPAVPVVVVRPGGSLGPGGGVGGRDVSVRRKASRAASPPRMVRMCIGPCGDGANCTLHLVSGGRRSEFLGLPLGRLAAVAASMRGVGIPSSRMVMEVMTKPSAC